MRVQPVHFTLESVCCTRCRGLILVISDSAQKRQTKPALALLAIGENVVNPPSRQFPA